MNVKDKLILKKQIEKAKVVSFDVFDTLLFRKTNNPETIFDLVGRCFGIHGFRVMRTNAQNEASRRAFDENGSPHADMDQIYEVLSERTDILVDWSEVKSFEIQIEKDALVANDEMMEIFKFAKEKGKRVVATTDMYLWADTIRSYLENCGYIGFDYIYCSADERAAKFNKALFKVLAEKENVKYSEIIHIGDKQRDDGDFPNEFGINTFIYHKDLDLDKVNKAYSSDIDNGIYKILSDNKKDFWYNLGVEVGGPLYMGLFIWMQNKLKDGDGNKRIFFLSRDGYILFNLFKKMGYTNIEYLYTSRRAMTLASVSDMSHRDLEVLPPYTTGQTVGEILEYLCVNKKDIMHLKEVGFSGYEDIIRNHEDIKRFKKLYILDKDVFLLRAKLERKNALEYLEKIGFTKGDNICFDCGWQGSSQELIESFKKSAGLTNKSYFYYFGIKNSTKSIKQLRGKQYEAFMFDFYKNYALQYDLDRDVALYELFFSSPENTVHYYGYGGSVVLEQGDCDRSMYDKLEKGILDYIESGYPFAQKYNVEFDAESSSGHLKRLISYPTNEEACIIGNLENVDSFTNSKNVTKYLGYIGENSVDLISEIEIYWPEGILVRNDVSDEIKAKVAERFGLNYPRKVPKYNLEDGESLITYQYWMCNNASEKLHETTGPMFSIVVPVYNTCETQLRECIDSILRQNYKNYELVLIDDNSTLQETREVLADYEMLDKVQIIYRTQNGNISIATNDGIEIANGEFIVFMDCDDTIEEDALSCFANAINKNSELDFLYSDEDKLTEDGCIRHYPSFKPDWSPDLFFNIMYTNHLAAYRSSIVKSIGGLRTQYNGAQDYDFTLRFMEHSSNERVGHISKVLYHWRERKESLAFASNSKGYAVEATKNVREAYIKRNNIHAHLEAIPCTSQFRMIYDVTGNPKVCIIIPSKDNFQVLCDCINSINKFCDYTNYEIIVVDNGSTISNRTKIEEFLVETKCKYIYKKSVFNFSAMCNLGAEYSDGEFLLFLNDDVEMFQKDWLSRMLGQAQQPHTGAVGAKLFYTDSTLIQHGGLANHVDGPTVVYYRQNDFWMQYGAKNWYDADYIAVTGACLLVDAKKFKEVGGFNEQLPVAYNDVDLCFKLVDAGYYNVQRNDVMAWHHESLSRGEDREDDLKILRLGKELANLKSSFPQYESKDPFINDNVDYLTNVLCLKKAVGHPKIFSLNTSYSVEGNLTIDSLSIGNSVRISGWAYIEGQPYSKKTKRYLLLKDIYGTCMAFEAIPVSRRDVAECFHNDDMEYCGFIGSIDVGSLRMDIMQYDLGVLTISPEGRKIITWGGRTELKGKCDINNKLISFERRVNEKINLKSEQVEWGVDQLEYDEKNDCYKVKGFAFKRNSKNSLYKISLLVLDEKNNGLELAMNREERFDVSIYYPEEHFVLNSGFSCNVYKCLLENATQYNFYLRFKNVCDESDIQDVWVRSIRGDV